MRTKFVKKKRGARLGQHFLNNPTIARALATAVGIRANETVVEIGPGTGALTRELLASGGNVLAVEKDPALVIRLRETFASDIQDAQLTVREGDIRDFMPEKVGLRGGEYVLAANIPYYITGEIIRQFLTAAAQPHSIGLLIQKEVADRIVAKDGKESILSLSVKAYGVPRIIRTVPPGNFTPPPSVDSAILLISNISRKFFDGVDESLFFTSIKAGFAAKRKKLRSNLARIFPKQYVEQACDSAGLTPDARAEDLTLETWRKITRTLNKQNYSPGVGATTLQSEDMFESVKTDLRERD